MDVSSGEYGTLVPFEYQASVASYLHDNEREVWDWAVERTSRADQLDSLRAALLRDTYRLDPQSHADVHAVLNTAMERLGIQVPATLYQSPGDQMNASLYFVPGEVHIIVQGPLLERMSQDELLAILGHELAHYVLWSRDGGRFLIAERILANALAAPGTSPSLRETYRRYSLYTELYADRGGAIACGTVGPAISSLVKVITGIRTVDPEAYLKQAREIESSLKSASDAHSHPETFIRARALELWHGDADVLTQWLLARLHGPLALENLDLPGQLQLQQLTREFLSYYLAGTDLGSDAVLAQIRSMFPDWRDDEPHSGLLAFAPDRVDDGVRDYLNALMLDLVLVDGDQQDAALMRAASIANQLGSMDRFQQNLRRDAGFGRRELDRFKRQLAKEAAA